jgi:hypothetical protein
MKIPRTNRRSTHILMVATLSVFSLFGTIQQNWAQILSSKAAQSYCSFGLSSSELRQTNSEVAAPEQETKPPDATITVTTTTDTNTRTETVSIFSLLLVSNRTEDLFAPNSPLHFNNTASSKSSTRDLVVTFVESGYLDTLSIWLHYYKQHDHSRRILCLFAVTDTAFDQIRSVLLSNQNNILQDLGPIILTQANLPSAAKAHEKLWKLRVQMLHRMAHAFPTTNILFSDADALWLHDPQELYLHPQHESSEVIASRGTFPFACPLGRDGQQGATACFGFVYFRNTPAFRKLTSDLINNMRARHGNAYDDQRAMNCILHKQYEAVKNSTLHDGSMVLTYDPLITVTLLPYSQVLRKCHLFHGDILSTVTVAHCQSHSTGKSKMEVFEKFQLTPQNVVMYEWSRKVFVELGADCGNSYNPNCMVTEKLRESIRAELSKSKWKYLKSFNSSHKM